VRQLVSGGWDVNEPVVVPNGQVWHPLKIALYDREEEIALALLEAGADLEHSGVAVHTVAGEGMAKTLRYLLVQDSGRFGEHIEDAGLSKAALRGYLDVVEVLVDFGSRRDAAWGPLLSEAAAVAMGFGHDDIARFLFENGAGLDGGVLHEAARASSPGMVRYLLSKGADVREERIQGTPIEYAWMRYSEGDRGGDREMVLFELLRAGAASGDLPAEGVAVDGLALLTTPEMLRDPPRRVVLAARLGFYDVTEQIVGDPLSVTGEVMRDATIAAIEAGHNDIARLLLRAGSPVNGGVLHAAAGSSSPGLVRDLLSRGADPAEMIDESTAAHYWLNAALAEEGPNSAYVLHELVRGGVDVCWILDYRTRISGLSRGILRDTATACWFAAN
jgi:hypothetical protein